MRPAVTIAALALLGATTLGGCGGSSPSGEPGGGAPRGGAGEAPHSGNGGAPRGASAQTCAASASGGEAIRVTGISCRQGRRLAASWSRRGDCAPARGASRSACAVGSYRCLATATGRGLAVGCSRPGRSIAFTASRPGGG